MFVQSKVTIHAKQKNGLPIRQRRAGKDTLVQWENGDQRWISTADLTGTIVLIGSQEETVHV